MDGICLSHWMVCVLSSMSSGERVTKSIRKHNCVMESDNLCFNNGISVVFTLFMKDWMGAQGNSKLVQYNNNNLYLKQKYLSTVTATVQLLS